MTETPSATPGRAGSKAAEAPGPEAKRHAPATARNRAAIALALQDWLPDPLPGQGCLLELASGTGEHAVYLSAQLPNLHWVPSEADPELRRSVEAYRLSEGGANLSAPLAIDVTEADWRLPESALPLAAMACINMIHIAPWAAAEGLFAGAARYLAPGGGLFLYGPFKRGGAHTAPSNAAFDESLRTRDPAWGVRDLEAVSDLARGAGLAAPLIREMPANNLSLWFARDAAGDAGR